MMHIPPHKNTKHPPGQALSDRRSDKTLADYIARKTEPTQPKKTFDEWMDEPYFELANKTVTRREWWSDNEISCAKDAWSGARK